MSERFAFNEFNNGKILETDMREKEIEMPNESMNSGLINQNQLENSILIKLRHSASQKPTFEQLMFLEQEKKHLWELLALKEETIEKLEQKISSFSKEKAEYQIEIMKRDQIIKILQERGQKLENEIKKVTLIRENIVEELNCLKKTFKEEKEQLFQETLKNKYQEKTVESNNFGINHRQRLYDENERLKAENEKLETTNKLLKQNLDEVLKELREIKVNVVEKFDMPNNNFLKENVNQLNLSLNENENPCIYSSFYKKKSNKTQERKRNLSSKLVSDKKTSSKKDKREKSFIEQKLINTSERKSLDNRVICLRQLPPR